MLFADWMTIASSRSVLLGDGSGSTSRIQFQLSILWLESQSFIINSTSGWPLPFFQKNQHEKAQTIHNSRLNLEGESKDNFLPPSESVC